jgi:hypothetical protein
VSGAVFEPIVLGHNAFFGVDHLSTQRGQEREAYFADTRRILDVMRLAADHGAGGMMMSTHARAASVAELLKQDARLAARFKLYPLLPYVQKYVVMANEKGLVNVIFDSLAGTSTGEKFRALWQGAKGVITKDLFGILSSLIQMELAPFKGLQMPAVFLHDAFTDLALTLNLKDIVSFYYEEMDRVYGSRAAFATKNLPLLLEKFDAWGFKEPSVMPHFNKIGFSMNPTREACELAVQKYPVQAMAMSTLASGFLKPDEAYEYLGKFSGIRSVVVGVSSPNHMPATFGAIKNHMSHLFGERK